MTKRTRDLTKDEINRKISRLAWQIYENNTDQREIVMVGISGRGELLAHRLKVAINSICDIDILMGIISLDKDDPYNNKISLNLSNEKYTDKVVVLVDDVLNSGKTLMYAATHFLTSPLTKLSTVVLVDRNHNKYPIKSDFVGLSLATTLQEYITVILQGNREGVYLS